MANHDWQRLIDLYQENQGLTSDPAAHWRNLIGSLERAAEGIEGDEERSRAIMARGRIWEEKLHANDKALEVYEHSWSTWRSNLEAISCARELYRQIGEHERVLQLYQLQLQLVPEGPEQAVVLREIGRTLLRDMNKPKSAIERLELAVTINSKDQEAKDLLDEAIGQSTRKARKRGKSAKERPERDTVETEVAEIDPEVADATEIASIGSDTVEIDSLEVADEAEEEVEVEEAQPEEEPRAEEPPEEMGEPGPLPDNPVQAAAELLRRAEAAAEKTDRGQAKGAQDNSIELYRELVKREPKHREGLRGLAARLGVAGDVREQIAILMGLLKDATTSTEVERARVDLGLAREASGEHDRAWEIMSAALADNPACPEALEFARRYHTERKNWTELQAIYERALDKRRRHELPFDAAVELADLLWKELGDHKQAETYFRRLRLSDPKNPRMLAFYADYYRREGDHKRLLTTLKSMRSREKDPDRWLEIAFEMADVAENQLKQPDRAIDVWKSVAQKRPDVKRASQALRRLYTQSNKFNALLEFVKGQLLQCDEADVERRVALLFDIAEIYRDHLNHPIGEASTLAEVLQIDPHNRRAANTLVERYESSGRWDDLVAELDRQASVEEEAAAEVALRRRVAELARDKLSDISRAIPQLERVAELAPDDAPVLEELRLIYEARGEHRALLSVLRREAQLMKPKERAAALRDMMKLASDVLSDQDETVAIAEALLDATDQTDELALRLLEQIYRRRQSYPELVRVLGARRKLIEAPAEKIALLLQLGEIHAQSLGQIDEGLQVYREARAMDPESEVVVSRIEELLVEAQRWDDVEALCAEREAWHRYYELLQRAVQDGDDPNLRIELYSRMAHLAADRLNDPVRATKCFEAVLQLNPSDLATAQALIPFYENSGSHTKLAEVLAVVESAREGTEAMALAVRIASIYERDLGQLDKALYWAGKAVELVPEDQAARKELERLSRNAGKVEEAVYLLREHAEGAPDALRMDLLRQAARLCFTDLRSTEADLATELYVELLARDPAAIDALDALEQLHREARRFGELRGILERRIELMDDPAEVVALRLRIAELESEELDDIPSAIETYNQILELDPRNANALQLLKTAHAKLEDWPAVIEVAGRQLEAAPDRRAVTLYELGQVYHHKIDDIPAAIESYAELLASHLETDVARKAVGHLSALLDDNRHRVVVAELLEPAFERLGDYAELAHVKEILVAQGKDAKAATRRRWELVELYERRLEQPAQAFASALAIARSDPSLDRPLDEIQRLAGVCGEWEPVGDLYRNLAKTDPDNLGVARRLGRVLEKQLSEPEQAIEAWLRIHRADATDREANEALERLYSAGKRTDDLVTLLKGRLAHAGEAAEAKRHLFRICETLEQAGRHMDAVQYYHKILDIDETEVRAFESLRQLLDVSQDWSALAELLKERISVCGPEEAAGLRLQLGSLRESSLSDLSGAAEMYREVLQDDPSNAVAAQALEALAREVLGEDERADLRRQVYGTLVPVYEGRKDYEAIIRLEKLQLADRMQEAERAAHARRIAEVLRDNLDRKAEALEHLAFAVQQGFEDEGARSELESLVAELGAWDKLVALYEEGIQKVEDPVARTALCRRLAQVNHEQLGDSEAAIQYYRTVLAAQPEDMPALGALERLYEATGDIRQLVLTRETKAGLVAGKERLELLRLNAEAQQTVLDSPEEAVDTYSLILEENPGDVVTLEALAGLYRKLSRWTDLVEVLREEVNAAQTDAQRRAVYADMAAVYDEKLDDRSAAIDAYSAIRDLGGEDMTTLQHLERLYQAEDRWSDLAGVLERQVALSDDDTFRAKVALRLARLRQDQLHDALGAIGLYREVLVYDAENGEATTALESAVAQPAHRDPAIDALLPSYEQLGRWEDVVRLLETRLENQDQLADQLVTLERVCQVCADRLGQPQRAVEACVRLYHLDPTAERRQELERLGEQAGDMERLAQAYRDAIPQLEASDEIAQVRIRLGEIHLHHLQEPDVAEKFYRQALEGSQDSLPALAALQSLYEEQGSTEELLDILEQRIALSLDTGDMAGALDLLHRVAQLHESVRDDMPAAMDACRRCLEIDQTDAEANEALERLLVAAENWPEYADLLRRQIGLSHDPHHIGQKKSALGRTLWNRLQEPGRAIEVFAEVLALEPGDAETVAALEGILEQQRTADLKLAARAASVLEPFYRETEGWGPLVEALGVRAQASEDAFEAADLNSEAAQLLEEKLDDRAQAFARWADVVRGDPLREAAWERAYQLAGPTGNWEKLADLLSEEVERGDRISPEQNLHLGLMLGYVLDKALHDSERAQVAFETVLDNDPANRQALDSLERIYNRQGAWDRLVDLYDQRVDMSDDPAEKTTYLLKVGRLAEDVLHEPDIAIDTYRRVLDVSPIQPEANRALERIYEFDLRYSELADLLQQRAVLAESDEERAETLMRLGYTLSEDLGELAQAVPVYRQVLDIRPHHEGVIAALEHLLKGLRRRGEAADLRSGLVTVLEDCYEPEGDWEKMVDLCQAKLEVSDDRTLRLETMHRAAELTLQYGGDRRGAMKFYAQAFVENPDDKPTAIELERLAEETGDYVSLSEAYTGGLPRSQDKGTAVELMLRTAGILENRLGDVDKAIHVLNEVLKVEPQHTEALAQLERLLESEGRWADLVEVLGRKVEMSSDLLDQKEYYEQIAGIQERRLEDLESAAATFRRILELDPEDIVALESLEGLLRRTQDFQELVNLLATKAEMLDTEAVRRETYLEVADLHEHHLGDLGSAIDVYRFLRANDPGDAEVVQALARLYERAERWAELLDIIEAQRESSASQPERDALDIRSAGLLQSKLGEVARAIETYRVILARNPNSEPALDALRNLADSDRGEQAADVLDTLYREWGDWEAVIGLLEGRLQHLSDRGRRYKMLREMARLYEDKLGQPTLAFRELSRALTERPQDREVFAELSRLAETHDMWDALATVLDTTAADSPDFARQLLLQSAAIHQSQLSDPVAAAQRYQSVVDKHPGDREALSALDALYTRQDDYEPLAEVLRREIGLADTEEEAIELRFRLAHIVDTVFHNESEAIDQYCDLLETRRDHAGAIGALERLAGDREHAGRVAPVLQSTYEQLKDWKRLADLYDLVLQFEEEPTRRAERFKQLAELYERRFDDAKAAFGHYCQALREMPELTEVQQKLERLCEDLDVFGALAELYDEIRERLGPAARIDLTRKAARWYDEKLDRLDLAEARYRELMAAMPSDSRPLEALEALLERTQDYAALVEILKLRAEQAPDLEARKQHLRRIVEIAHSPLEDPRVAASAHRRILNLDPEDTESVLALVRIYGELEEVGPLADILERQAELTESPEERARIHQAIGRLAQERLDDPRRAAKAFSAALALQPGDGQLFDVLERLHEQLQDWSALRNLLAERLKAGVAEQRLEVMHRLAKVHEAHFDETDRAVELYRGALKEQPRDRVALQELSRLFAEKERWAELTEVQAMLESVMLEDVDAERDNLVQLYLDMSALQRERLTDRRAAADSLRRLLSISPRHQPALATLGELLEAESELEEALEIIGREIEVTSEGPAVADLYHRQSQLQQRTGADSKAIKESLELALQYDSERLDVAEELKSLYEADGDWEPYWSVASLLVKEEKLGEEKKRKALELAEVAREHLKDSGRLLRALQVAYSVDPDDPKVTDQLALAYVAAGEYDKASPLIDAMVQSSAEGASDQELARLHHLRGEILKGRADLAGAEAAFREAYRLNHAYGPNLMSLGRLLYDQNQLDEALKHFQNLLLHQMSQKDKEDPVEIYFLMGEINRRKGDRKRARDHYLRALWYDKGHEPSKRALAEVE